MSDDDGFSLDQVSDAAQTVTRRFREFLGVEFEAHVCPDCGVACEPTETYDVHRAPEYGGKAPAWECPDCGRQWVREEREPEQLSGDMYGRE